MINTKLVEILKTFSKDEFREFEKFIRSPYFNKGRNLVPFYKALKSFHPEFINQNFTSEFIFKKIHPDLKFESKKSENILRVLSSEMLNLGKEFIKQEELKSQEMTNYLLKLESLKKRNLKDLFLRNHSEILNECESKINLDSDFFLKYHLIIKANYSVSGEFFSDINEIASLFNYFFYNSALFFINEKVQKRNTNKLRNSNFLINLFKLVDLEKFLILIKEDSMSQKNKDLMTYFTWFYMFSLCPSDAKCLAGFEEIFYKEKKFLDREIKFLGYCAISNYYAYNPNKTKLYETNKNFLKENMFDPIRFPMSLQVFRGIFINFINIGNNDEALEFVVKYQSYLSPEINKSIYNFCIAELEFRKKDYKKALDSISKIEFSIFVLKFDLRNLYLKIYYSLNYLEEAIYLLQSYRKFLRGNKNVSAEMKKNLLNFLIFYEKLFKLKTSNDKSAIKVFKKEFDNLPQDFSMQHKSWIKEELNML